MRRWTLLSGTIVVVVIVAIVLAAMTVGGRGQDSRQAPKANQVGVVADGTAYVARLVGQPNGAFVVQINDATTGALVLQSTFSVNASMPWQLLEDEGTIWVSSSDRGTYVFVYSGGAWKELEWVNVASQYPMPESIFVELPKSVQERYSSYRKKGN